MRIFFSALLIGSYFFSVAQENINFQKPSSEIYELANFERVPSVMISPDTEWMLSVYRPTYKSLNDLNQEEMRLAGLRINPLLNISSGVTYSHRITIKPIAGKEEMQITGMPENAQIAHISFSPDSKHVAFTNTTAKGVELWVVNVQERQAKKLSADNLNANMGNPYTWYKDSQKLLIERLPENRNPLIDGRKDLPKGPIVSNSTGEVSQLRTYQDLLKTPDDEANFETLAKSELYWIALDGTQSKFKDAAIYSNLSFSPDGNYILATTIERPYSYVVALYSFPQNSVVYDINGNLIKEVNKVPLIEIQPKGFSSTRIGKRNMYWRADKPASLYYVEALDGGDATKSAEFRDELYSWDAPFSSDAQSLMKLTDRFAGVLWGDANNVIVSTSFYDTRSDKRYLLNPTTGESKLILERNSQDVYSHPGSVHMERNDFGRYVMYIDKNKIYWTGPGFSKEGQFPFIEEQDLKSLAKKRIYTSEFRDKKEDIVSITDIKRQLALVSIQSATEYPNYYLRDLKKNKLDTLTRFENPFQSLANVHKEVINYKRNDGVDLSGTLYLPAGYDRNAKSEKLPLLIWAYPTEFNSKDAAGQSTANPNSFTFPSYGSFIYWVSKGYAVLDDASFPIIGEKGVEPNDTFIEQLVANGKAAIDAVDELGYIDRSKVGVGGHSYGAFMVAHLLSNSDLFAAGVARSGAYNRTLTPFGFQREQRNYWDNPELYHTMSPFMSANRMKTPILLIHGNADNNPGTFTLQTERYFQALKNLGAPARMVLLPLESHGYAAEESIMHTLWEQDQFLEKYLK